MMIAKYYQFMKKKTCSKPPSRYIVIYYVTSVEQAPSSPSVTAELPAQGAEDPGRLPQHLAGAPEFADAEHEPIPLLEREDSHGLGLLAMG